MEIYLGDIIPTSTLDWPGKVVMTVFFRGCPFRCPYCSNSQLLDQNSKEPVDVEGVLSEIDKARDFIDGVVVSGGEPFMQLSAFSAIAGYAKSLGLLVGAQTNGMYPDRIAQAASEGLLDALMLDFKAPLNAQAYAQATGEPGRSDILEAVRKTVDRGNRSRKDGTLSYYEVRTTVFRGLSDTPEDIADITSGIECDAYVLQQGRPEIAMDESVRCRETMSRQDLLALGQCCRKGSSQDRIKTIKIRTRELGDEIIVL